MVVQGAVDEIFEAALAAGDVPGVVALAADEHGVVYSGAFGYRDVAQRQAMKADSVFRIASMTKLITCVAVLQLVEEGKLSLDEPLGRLLPELASPQVLEGFDATWLPRLRPATRPITMRLLLTHTAGFGYQFWNEALNRYGQAAGAGLTGKMATLGAPLVFDPGERWEYGINIDWAGEAVEAAAGISLEDYMREQIFSPLGMCDTAFVLGPGQNERLAGLHRREADGSLKAVPPTPSAPPAFFAGGGGLHSTGPDYLTFLQALLHGGTLEGVQILRRESVAELMKNQIGDFEVGGFKSAMPAVSNDGEFFPGMVKRWSLGGMLTTEEAATGRCAGSLSWCGLFNSYYWLDPERRLTGVVLTQILPFLDAGVLALVDRFERAVYAAHRA